MEAFIGGLPGTPASDRHKPAIRKFSGVVAEWLRRSVANHARSTRVGSNPVVGATSQKPTFNSAVHASEVGKSVLNVTLRAQELDTH